MLSLQAAWSGSEGYNGCYSCLFTAVTGSCRDLSAHGGCKPILLLPPLACTNQCYGVLSLSEWQGYTLKFSVHGMICTCLTGLATALWHS